MNLDSQPGKQILAQQEQLYLQFKGLIEWFFLVFTGILTQKNAMLRQRGYTFDKKESLKISKFLELKLSQLHSLYICQRKTVCSILHEEKIFKQKYIDLEKQMNSDSTLNLDLSLSPRTPDYIESTPQTKKKVHDWPINFTEKVREKVQFWEDLAGKNLLGLFNENI